MDTLNGYSINALLTPRLTLDQHSINILVNSQLIFNQCLLVGQHLADYQPTVGQVLIECRLGIDWDFDQVLFDMSIEVIDQHSTVDVMI